MRTFLLPALSGVSLLLGGCVASTVAGVVTAPVKVASKAADWATTSQDEADRKRGRELRKAEEREGRDQRECEKHPRKCDRH